MGRLLEEVYKLENVGGAEIDEASTGRLIVFSFRSFSGVEEFFVANFNKFKELKLSTKVIGTKIFIFKKED